MHSPLGCSTCMCMVATEDMIVQELRDAPDLPQGTAYTYVNRLVDAGTSPGKSTSR